MDGEMKITEMTTEYAHLVLTWTYEDVYSRYNHGKDFIDVCTDGNHFAFTDENGELLGYCCFGFEAKVPTEEENAYDDNFLDVGLHIRPDLCGKKLGASFINACLDFAKNKYGTSRFRATIASFNERAKTLCIRAGFYVEQEVTHYTTKNKFTIMKREE